MDTGASITNFLLYYIKEDLLYFYGKKFENLKYIKVCDFIKKIGISQKYVSGLNHKYIWPLSFL